MRLVQKKPENRIYFLLEFKFFFIFKDVFNAEIMKSIEIYGFVGWIGTFILYSLYLIWAFVPDSILHKMGIYYYPSKYWALAIPSIICLTFIFIFILYQSLNMVMTHDIDNLNILQGNIFFHMKVQNNGYNMNILDIHTKFKPKNETKLTDSLPEIYDLPINVINNAIFYQKEMINSFKVLYE